MVVRSLFLRGDGFRAGVQHREAAGPVGRLHHPRLEAGLADRRRLLVAGNTADRDLAAEERGLCRAEISGAVLHLRQH